MRLLAGVAQHAEPHRPRPRPAAGPRRPRPRPRHGLHRLPAHGRLRRPAQGGLAPGRGPGHGAGRRAGVHAARCDRAGRRLRHRGRGAGLRRCARRHRLLVPAGGGGGPGAGDDRVAPARVRSRAQPPREGRRPRRRAGLPDAGGQPQDRPRGGALARGRPGGLPRAHGIRPHDHRLRHAGGVARGGGPRTGRLRVLHAAPLLRRREPPLQRPAIPDAVDVPGGGGQRLAPRGGRPLHLVHVLAPGRPGAFHPRPVVDARADRRGRQALLPAAPHRRGVDAGRRLPLPPPRVDRSRPRPRPPARDPPDHRRRRGGQRPHQLHPPASVLQRPGAGRPAGGPPQRRSGFPRRGEAQPHAGGGALHRDVAGDRGRADGPEAGDNRLEIALLERPSDLRSKVGIEDVELVVEYGVWDR